MFTNEQHLNWIATGQIGEALLSYAMIKGVGKEVLKAGLWKDTVDDHWTIVCNGTANKIDFVPAFSWSIEFNGWPAGIISVITGEGVILDGEIGNAKTLQKALLESISSHLKQTT